MDTAIDRVLTLLRNVRPTGNGWLASCPAPGHGKRRGDRNPSLHVSVAQDGRVLLHCFAGCSTEDVVRSLGLEMRDLFPRVRANGKPQSTKTAKGKPRDNKQRQQDDIPNTVTIASLAAAKGLPVEFVGQFCEQLRVGRIRIVYRLPDGSRAPRHRIRRGTPEDKVVFWEGGRNGPKPVPYGLERLGDARQAGYLVLVEGETDCWTLWYHGFPALGIPGASMAGTLAPEYLDGIGRVYVWREPDKGGQDFAQGVARRLAAIGWNGQAYVMSVPGVKDPNELHQRDPGAFPQTFREALERAEPLPLGDVATADEREPVPEDDAAPAPGEDQPGADQPRGGAGERRRRKPRLPGGDDDTIPGGPPGREEFTDLGNAKRFARLEGRNIRYVRAWGQWLIWDGRRWAKDETNAIYHRAQVVIQDLLRAARDLADQARKTRSQELREGLEAKAEETLAWARRTESRPRLEAIVALAETLPDVSVTHDLFDADPWLLNVRNGTLDLRTGELRPHRREDMITMLAPVEYDPAARCPTWEAFLDRIMGGNQRLIAFLRRAVGYALTGDTSEQVLFLLYGTGSNGKTTFIDVLRALLGDYGAQADFKAFLDHYRAGVRNDIARLVGTRFVSAVEANPLGYLDETLIKQLTGGDRIVARFLYREFFEFRPQFKLFLAANHKPRIRGTDHAIWRRIRLIPFTVTIPQKERDKNLPKKLLAELPGILNWALEGCLEWQRRGLDEPPEVLAATEAYRAEMDVLAAFVDECCVVHPTARARAAVLYDAYVQWCHRNGERPLTQKEFGIRLSERGFERRKTTGGKIDWLGIGLVDNSRWEADEADEADRPTGKLPYMGANEQSFSGRRPLHPLPPLEVMASAPKPDEGGWEEGEI